jgi:hypothetical protein
LQQEAHATIQLIAEVPRRAEEATAASVAATNTSLAQALMTVEAARQKEAMQERLREEAAQAAELVVEATRLAETKAIDEARDQGHRMAVHSPRSLKVDHDRAQGRLDAAKAANAAIKHKKEILAANREANKQLRAILEHAKQVAQ